MEHQRPSIPDIVANVGETFQVKVRGNQTTGYVWALSHLPLSVYLLNVDYVSDHPVTIGSGGIYIFTFGAVAACQDYLKFDLVRPWELLEPKETKTISIMISNEPCDKDSKDFDILA